MCDCQGPEIGPIFLFRSGSTSSWLSFHRSFYKVYMHAFLRAITSRLSFRQDILLSCGPVRHGALVAHWIVNPPGDLQGYFRRGFEALHPRTGLAQIRANQALHGTLCKTICVCFDVKVLGSNRTSVQAEWYKQTGRMEQANRPNGTSEWLNGTSVQAEWYKQTGRMAQANRPNGTSKQAEWHKQTGRLA
ncbi:hypothetical protein PoB_001066900 [Plakobranchus ocellatus]|uniref:Uncharacterized protein n=1 Tax=Plakobranchus ocellatus TaxID=259542 RepID=A0AAV3YMC3_9GAST|nr:hypothetical protein PoB_001066900 [Plakobranchus ocellatus]